VFCDIVAGSVPAFTVSDGPAGVAFLDTRPVFKGHVLVVPRAHAPNLPDLPSSPALPQAPAPPSGANAADPQQLLDFLLGP